MDYELHYWDLPFRGIFPELLLVEAELDYERRPPGGIYPDHRLERDAPGMAPPFLVDCKTGRTLSQMPAIVDFLARRHDLAPEKAWERSLMLKLTLDANDVLDEVTLRGGMKMWTQAEWDDFREYRLAEWMRLFEAVAALHEGEAMLGDFSAADLVTLALWGTMTHALPALREDLERHAPAVAAICDRTAERPRVRAFLERQRAKDGQAWCGGQIETSLREVTGGR